jgi:soluble lytic murein transglycosylase-like protein
MNAEDRYDSLFQFYAYQRGLDWLYLKAQAKQESAFNPDAVSPAGAVGLFQFMPNTWKEWDDGTPGIQPVNFGVKLVDPRCPECATVAAGFYNRWLLDYFSGDIQKALAGFNWGPTNVRKAVAAKAYEWSSLLPEETANYVVRIQKYRREFKA